MFLGFPKDIYCFLRNLKLALNLTDTVKKKAATQAMVGFFFVDQTEYKSYWEHQTSTRFSIVPYGVQLNRYTFGTYVNPYEEGRASFFKIQNRNILLK